MEVVVFIIGIILAIIVGNLLRSLFMSIFGIGAMFSSGKGLFVYYFFVWMIVNCILCLIFGIG